MLRESTKHRGFRERGRESKEIFGIFKVLGALAYIINFNFNFLKSFLGLLM